MAKKMKTMKRKMLKIGDVLQFAWGGGGRSDIYS